MLIANILLMQASIHFLFSLFQSNHFPYDPDESSKKSILLIHSYHSLLQIDICFAECKNKSLYIKQRINKHESQNVFPVFPAFISLLYSINTP